MVRSTLMPSSAVIVRSCSQARCWRPNEVRVISQVKPGISATVTTTIRICEYERCREAVHRQQIDAARPSAGSA